MHPTQVQLNRISNEWSRAAGETVEVRMLGGAFLANCSELGAFRIVYNWYKGKNPHVRMGETECGTFYVLLEPRT